LCRKERKFSRGLFNNNIKKDLPLTTTSILPFTPPPPPPPTREPTLPISKLLFIFQPNDRAFSYSVGCFLAHISASFLLYTSSSMPAERKGSFWSQGGETIAKTHFWPLEILFWY
jgi:hypothetical protein